VIHFPAIEANSMSITPKRYFALLACLALTNVSGFCQTTNSTIVGDVTDPAGARIATADITVTNSATSVSRKVQANEVGSYRVFPLPPGTYEVSASANGFKPRCSKT
jgi:hypothetical protein